MMQGYVTKHMFVITVVFSEVNTHVLNLLWAAICIKFALKCSHKRNTATESVSYKRNTATDCQPQEGYSHRECQLQEEYSHRLSATRGIQPHTVSHKRDTATVSATRGIQPQTVSHKRNTATESVSYKRNTATDCQPQEEYSHRRSSQVHGPTNGFAEDWFAGYMKHYPNLSLRRPEATSLSRATSFNQKNVKEFYDNLEQVMEKNKFAPHDIYNADEKGCTTVQKVGNTKVVACKNEKQVGKITSGERGTLVTMLGAVNAAGNSIPPFIVFRRSTLRRPCCMPLLQAVLELPIRPGG